MFRFYTLSLWVCSCSSQHRVYPFLQSWRAGVAATACLCVSEVSERLVRVPCFGKCLWPAPAPGPGGLLPCLGLLFPFPPFGLALSFVVLTLGLGDGLGPVLISNKYNAPPQNREVPVLDLEVQIGVPELFLRPALPCQSEARSEAHTTPNFSSNPL